MSNPHEPRDVFVEALEHRVRRDFASRHAAAPAPGWLLQSKTRFALAAVLLVLVSMAIGGGVVAAAYEAERREQRSRLVEMFEQRAEILKRQLALTSQQLRGEEEQLAVGIGNPARVREARLRVAEAEGDVRLVEIDLVEVRATGREPMTGVSAPLVQGRDLVTDRWLAARSVRAAALELERENVKAARTRVEVGLANEAEVEATSMRVFELESAIRLIEQKIEIRQALLKGSLTAAAADLRVLATETEQRRLVLERRLELARQQMQNARKLLEIGRATPIELAEAELKLQELQLALTQTDYELTLIHSRTQLAK